MACHVPANMASPFCFHDSLLTADPGALLSGCLVHVALLPSVLICESVGHVRLTPVAAAAYHLKTSPQY